MEENNSTSSKIDPDQESLHSRDGDTKKWFSQVSHKLRFSHSRSENGDISPTPSSNASPIHSPVPLSKNNSETSLYSVTKEGPDNSQNRDKINRKRGFSLSKKKRDGTNKTPESSHIALNDEKNEQDKTLDVDAESVKSHSPSGRKRGFSLSAKKKREPHDGDHMGHNPAHIRLNDEVEEIQPEANVTQKVAETNQLQTRKRGFSLSKKKRTLTAELSEPTQSDTSLNLKNSKSATDVSFFLTKRKPFASEPNNTQDLSFIKYDKDNDDEDSVLKRATMNFRKTLTRSARSETDLSKILTHDQPGGLQVGSRILEHRGLKDADITDVDFKSQRQSHNSRRRSSICSSSSSKNEIETEAVPDETIIRKKYECTIVGCCSSFDRYNQLMKHIQQHMKGDLGDSLTARQVSNCVNNLKYG